MAISENLVVEFYIVRWAYKKFHFEPFRTLEIGLRSRKSVFDMFFIVFRGEFNLGKGFFGILFKVSTTLKDIAFDKKYEPLAIDMVLVPVMDWIKMDSMKG